MTSNDFAGALICILPFAWLIWQSKQDAKEAESDQPKVWIGGTTTSRSLYVYELKQMGRTIHMKRGDFLLVTQASKDALEARLNRTIF